ncbi:MAG TPA: fibronectin type III domain-containing protein [Amycolatopsis sp.]|nr:fibronectin type III domain-containing protein [Amycolatopsis sp.]
MRHAGRIFRGALAGLIAIAATVVAATPPAAAQPPGPAAQPAPALAQTPYLGWSSWSLESTNYPGVNPNGSASWLNEHNVLAQADVLAAKLKQHGYTYVNIDAGWMGGVDAYGRPVVDTTKFPDGMAYVADYVHGKGLKLGSYLAVGLDPRAYNGGNTPIYGTTDCFTRDIVYPDLRTTNGWDSAYQINYANPCAQSYIDSIADLLAGWGVDFLKLDGVGPGSFRGGPNYDNTADVAAWSAALKQTGRPIQFVISWALSHTKADVWQQNTNGWRVDTDVECYCNTLVTWNNSVKQRWNDVVQWIPDAGPGHWNNLDSLDVGNGTMDGITDAERQSYMTLWAISGAPLYSGDDLTTLDSYGLSLLTNDEVIAVDQAGIPARPLSQSSDQQVWYSRNPDGSYTVALFNLGTTAANVTAEWRDLGITSPAQVRDLWSHSDLGTVNGSFGAQLPAHGSRLLRITPHAVQNAPAVPLRVHGTGATASGVSLAWDASTYRDGAISGYEVSVDGGRAEFVPGTTATVSGLPASTTHQFTVTAVGADGRRSAPSAPVSVTTTGPGGPVTYEAEDPGNAVAGGAAVFDCAGCSGGKKVGYLGGTGTLTFPAVTAAQPGTYLMTVSYVDGDTSRVLVVTVNGQQIQVPVAGSGDNDWGSAQTVTVPVPLRAGANTIQFGNPGDYAPDVDKLTV